MSKIVPISFCVIACLCLPSLSSAHPSKAAGVEPTIGLQLSPPSGAVVPQCSTAGYTVIDYNDPTYGSAVRELLNSNGNQHNIYYWRNTWNANNTYMVGIQSDLKQKNWHVVLYSGDGCFIKTLFTPNQFDWRLVWDRVNPDLFYTKSGHGIYAYNVETDTAKLLKSVPAPYPLSANGLSLNQAGDRIFVLRKNGATGSILFSSFQLPDMTEERDFTVSFPSGCTSTWQEERFINYNNDIVTGCESPKLNTKMTYIFSDTGVLEHMFTGLFFGHTDFSPDGHWAYFQMRTGQNPLTIHEVGIDGSDDHVLYSAAPKAAQYVRNMHIAWPSSVTDHFFVSFFPSSTYLPSTYAPPLDEIMQLNTDGSYAYLARTYTAIPPGFSLFWAEPLASPSSDGQRIDFNSDAAGTINQFILYPGS